MQNKINKLIESNAAFALVCASGIMDYRDWFIAACTTDKKLMRELKAKKNRKLKHIYEIPMNDKDLKDFEQLKSQLRVDHVSECGVVYENPNNPLKIAALRHEIDVCKDRLSRLKEKCENVPTDTLFNKIERLSARIKRLNHKLNQGL